MAIVYKSVITHNATVGLSIIRENDFHKCLGHAGVAVRSFAFKSLMHRDLGSNLTEGFLFTFLISLCFLFFVL